MPLVRITLVLALIPTALMPRVQAWAEIRAHTEDAYYLGSYEVLNSGRGSIFVGRRDLDRVIILEHPPSNTAPAWTFGAGGRLKYVPLKPTTGAPLAGALIEFKPLAKPLKLDQAASKIRNPFLLGLLAGRQDLEPGLSPRLFALPAHRDTQLALAGLVTAGAMPLAERLLAAHPPRRTREHVGDQDFRVLLPWLRQGLAAAPALDADEEACRLSPGLCLLPALRAWFSTRSPEYVMAAHLDALDKAGRASVLGTPPTDRGWLDNAFDYGRILRELEPGLHQLLRQAENGLAYWEAMQVLDAVAAEGETYIVLWDPKLLERTAMAYRGERLSSVFGSRADLLVRVMHPDDFRRGVILRGHFQKQERQAVLAQLAGLSPGYRLGYLAKAAQTPSAGWTWEDWRRELDTIIARDGWRRINNAEIFQLSLAPVVADVLAQGIPGMARERSYADAGEQGMRIAAVYLRHAAYDQAGRVLDQLPEALRHCRETYDSRGDIGWANRSAIAWMQVLAARLAKVQPPEITTETREHWRYAADTVRTVLVTVPGIPVPAWEALMQETP